MLRQSVILYTKVEERQAVSWIALAWIGFHCVLTVNDSEKRTLRRWLLAIHPDPQPFDHQTIHKIWLWSAAVESSKVRFTILKLTKIGWTGYQYAVNVELS
jgi:hypothetical protein